MAFDDDDDDVFGRAYSGLHHREATRVSLMLNFFRKKIVWSLEHELK